MIFIGAALCASHAYGQVGINSSTPHPSSMLMVAPTNLKGEYKGTLLSPMTTNQINSIVNPANGLIVYDTDKKCLKINKIMATYRIWVCLRTR